jgi:enhancing lycopene biosynthesis protein 2
MRRDLILSSITAEQELFNDTDIDKAFELAKNYEDIFASEFTRCDINYKNVELIKRLENAGKDVVFLNDKNVASIIHNYWRDR